MLESFAQTEMKAERAKGNMSIVYAIEQRENFHSMGLGWSERGRPSRSMDTADLDQSVKDDLIKDFETFVEPGRADWYIERGIPYYHGYPFRGPPGTGKSSTAFALVCPRIKRLYTLNLKGVRNETQLRQLFGAPRKGDVLLLKRSIQLASAERRSRS